LGGNGDRTDEAAFSSGLERIRACCSMQPSASGSGALSKPSGVVLKTSRISSCFQQAVDDIEVQGRAVASSRRSAAVPGAARSPDAGTSCRPDHVGLDNYEGPSRDPAAVTSPRERELKTPGRPVETAHTLLMRAAWISRLEVQPRPARACLVHGPARAAPSQLLAGSAHQRAHARDYSRSA